MQYYPLFLVAVASVAISNPLDHMVTGSTSVSLLQSRTVFPKTKFCGFKFGLATVCCTKTPVVYPWADWRISSVTGCRLVKTRAECDDGSMYCCDHFNGDTMVALECKAVPDTIKDDVPAVDSANQESSPDDNTQDPAGNANPVGDGNNGPGLEFPSIPDAIQGVGGALGGAVNGILRGDGGQGN